MQLWHWARGGLWACWADSDQAAVMALTLASVPAPHPELCQRRRIISTSPFSSDSIFMYLHTTKRDYGEWCPANVWEELSDKGFIIFSILKQFSLKQRSGWMSLVEGLISSSEIQEGSNWEGAESFWYFSCCPKMRRILGHVSFESKGIIPIHNITKNQEYSFDNSGRIICQIWGIEIKTEEWKWTMRYKKAGICPKVSTANRFFKCKVFAAGASCLLLMQEVAGL